MRGITTTACTVADSFPLAACPSCQGAHTRNHVAVSLKLAASASHGCRGHAGGGGGGALPHLVHQREAALRTPALHVLLRDEVRGAELCLQACRRQLLQQQLPLQAWRAQAQAHHVLRRGAHAEAHAGSGWGGPAPRQRLINRRHLCGTHSFAHTGGTLTQYLCTRLSCMFARSSISSSNALNGTSIEAPSARLSSCRSTLQSVTTLTSRPSSFSLNSDPYLRNLHQEEARRDSTHPVVAAIMRAIQLIFGMTSSVWTVKVS